MEDLAKLLSTVEALDPDKRAKEEAPPTDEELTEARTGLVEGLKAAAEGERPNLEDARAIRQAIDAIDAEVVSRAEQREAERAEAAKLLEGIDGADIKAADGDDEGDGDKEDDKSDDEGDGDKEPEASKEKVTVAASLSDAINRSAKRKAERAADVASTWDVLVSTLGPAQGFSISQDADLDAVAQIFNRFAPQVRSGRSTFVHMDRLYPEDRALGLSAEENTRAIDKFTSPRAITAAGGICEPLPADFSHPICGDRGRPITDALPSFRADRGGIRFAPNVTIGDLSGAITVWTSETDADPGSDTKACPRIECEDELSATVDAIVACLTVGNFQARFNPEFWRSRLDLLMIEHDRVAEQTAYATMVAASQTTTAPAAAGDGTITDLLRVIDLQVAGIRSRNRLIGTQFRTVLPLWTRNALRTQLANQAPAGSADLFDVGDQRLNNFFAVRGVTPVWSPDIELLAASQGAGALENYNTPFNVLTFPEGTFVFFDGGTLDLGTQIVDSTLNATNDRQAFMETFEQVVKRGCESLVTPVTVAADCICA